MKKMLLLAVAATMALGISAKEPAKAAETPKKEKMEIRDARRDDGKEAIRFHRHDDKKRPHEMKKVPMGKRLEKAPCQVRK